MQDADGLDGFVQSVVGTDLEGFVEGSLATADVLADWDPDLHPRGPDGKFIDSLGSYLEDLNPGDVFGDFNGEDGRERVRDLTQRWVGWPTDSNTASMWRAAEEITGNINAPADVRGIPMLDLEADDGEIETYKEYSEHVSETLREEAGETIVAHRFIHSEAADTLRDGGSLDPRTLSSWTTDIEQIPELVESIPTPEGDFADPDRAVVVTKEIPVENVFDHHAVNPELDSSGQKEVVVGLDQAEDLSGGLIRTVSDLREEPPGEGPEETGVDAQSADPPRDIPNILLGYDFERPAVDG